MKSTVKENMTPEQMVEIFGPGLRFDEPLDVLCSFRTGGSARYFVAATSDREIANAIVSAKEIGLSCFLLGGGSNVLISDSGFDGLVIKVNVNGIRLKGDSEIVCGAGEDLMDLVNFATTHSLTGIEFLSGIPGSVGGAVAGNAGAFGGEIGSTLSKITLVGTDGEIKTVDPDYCQFDYRHSNLQETNEIVSEVSLQLSSGVQSEISRKVDGILALRREKHPTCEPSAGSFFKNIPDQSEPYGKLPAGRLLDEAGARSMSSGGARVYEKHANIIINSGEASSKDIDRLADNMKRAVRDKFNIELVEEVVKVGEF